MKGGAQSGEHTDTGRSAGDFPQPKQQQSVGGEGLVRTEMKGCSLFYPQQPPGPEQALGILTISQPHHGKVLCLQSLLLWFTTPLPAWAPLSMFAIFSLASPVPGSSHSQCLLQEICPLFHPSFSRLCSRKRIYRDKRLVAQALAAVSHLRLWSQEDLLGFGFQLICLQKWR